MWWRKKIRSTREETIAETKPPRSLEPPASMSAEEMQAWVAREPFAFEELNSVPDKELQYERPTSSKDGPKNVSFGMTERERNFWFNLVVGCSGPDSVSKTVVPGNGFRSRNAAKLAYAEADVKRLRSFVCGHIIMEHMGYPSIALSEVNLGRVQPRERITWALWSARQVVQR
jgi:hypothetical protein